MEYLNISRLTQADFDAFIESIGGHRFSHDDTREEKLNCDYEYADALIELKLIEENPSEKKSKQQKLAELFGRRTKTVVIDPDILNAERKKQYHRILETPLKTAIKKASKQLRQSSEIRGGKIKVAIIINNGLTLMLPEEFERVAIKCAKNDTSGIDILLIGGLYYFSDKFDGFIIERLLEIYLHERRDDIVRGIKEGWSQFLDHFMTRQILDDNIVRNKEPVQDISFTIGEVLYVKPPPKFGKPSNFWPDGVRPREDSTGLSSCPPVATILPELNVKSYEVARSSIEDAWRLRGTLRYYSEWISDEVRQSKLLTRPLVGIPVPPEKANVASFHDLCIVAADIFNLQIHEIIDRASVFTEKHQSLNYILLQCVEIGIDKANDISFIEHIIEFPGLERRTIIIEGERLKFEYALAVASAHCIRLGADTVYYVRNEKYKWV